MSIVGLGMPDESEIDSIDGAVFVNQQNKQINWIRKIIEVESIDSLKKIYDDFKSSSDSKNSRLAREVYDQIRQAKDSISKKAIESDSFH